MSLCDGFINFSYILKMKGNTWLWLDNDVNCLMKSMKQVLTIIFKILMNG
jgi:hypothetical protein